MPSSRACIIQHLVANFENDTFSDLATVHQAVKNNECRFRQSAAVAAMLPQKAEDHSHIFRSRSACGSQTERSNNSKQIENQICSVTKKPVCFLQLQGLARDWSTHNEHSRNIFSVHGFLSLGVTFSHPTNNSSLASYFPLKILAFETPHQPLEISNDCPWVAVVLFGTAQFDV